MVYPVDTGDALLDDPVGSQEERLRDREPETRRGPEVQDQLEPRRLLDGQVGRPRALQKLVHEQGGAPVEPGAIAPSETRPPASGTSREM